MATVTIHMVASLDGYIAKADGSVSWMETTDSYAEGVDEEDAEAFLNTIDCFVLGSRTYEDALRLGWPYGDVPTIVMTHRNLHIDRKSVDTYAGDLGKLMHERLAPYYHNIWVVGGAMLARDFIRAGLAQDLRLSILPVILGDGIPFLSCLGQMQAIHLKKVTAYKSGMVELWYELKR